MSKLRGAIIGFGNIAEKGHWPTYADSKDVEIVAIMDPSLERQRVARTLRPGINAYSSVDDLLQKEKLDFVDICTPPASHTAIAIQALKNGCHVLCEKPLSLKREDYHALEQAQKAADKTVFTVHNWKYAPIFQQAFAWLNEGRIGRVWHTEIFTLRSSHCKGATIETPTKPGALSEDWRKDASVAGGGILIDHGWHSFYLLMALIGAEPKSVLSKMLRPDDNPQALEEETQTLVQFGNADGYIYLTWRSPLRRNSVIVQGLKGTLLLDDDRLSLATHDGAREEKTFAAGLSAGSHHADWFTALFPDFLKEIRDTKVRGQNFQEARWCLALTEAAYQSSGTNKEVSLNSLPLKKGG